MTKETEALQMAYTVRNFFMTKETEALLTIAQVVVRWRTKDQRPANQFDCNAGVNSAADLFEANGFTTTPEQRLEVHAELMRRMA